MLNRDIASDRPQCESVRGFFRSLVDSHMLPVSAASRIDFLACNGVQGDEAEHIAKTLQSAIVVCSEWFVLKHSILLLQCNTTF